MGWLTHRDLLIAYNARLERSVASAASRGAAAPVRPIPAQVTAAPPASMLPELKDYRIVDVELNANGHPVGRLISEVAWPPRSLVVALRRGGAVEVPTGETLLHRGDRLSVLVPAAHAEGLAERLSTAPENGHAESEATRG
jgi:NhaP-type Na+/H+ and K+/H+ antiporter